MCCQFSLTTVATASWDPVADRFLRLRQQGGTTYWDTSSDGMAYSQRASTTSFTVTSSQLELGAGAFATVANGGTARFASALLVGP